MWGNKYLVDSSVQLGEDNYELPTLKQVWEDYSKRYDFDLSEFPGIEAIDTSQIKVLPLRSDPTMEDSDGDGLLDPDDSKPFRDDFKELWYKMTVNEKEFYVGHTGYGINSVQAHVFDHSTDTWKHYGLLDGIWVISDNAKQIKEEIDNIKGYFDLESQSVTFEHPDEDVVIDLDEIWGTCRMFIEGYDSFIEDVKANNREEFDIGLGIFIGLIDCYFDDEPSVLDAKCGKGIDFDKKEALFKMATPNLDEVKSLVLFLLDEDEEELETHYTYMEVKVTTDKACTFGFSVISGATTLVGAKELAKGAGEIKAGIASAPATAGAGLAIAAKGGIDLKKGVEKLDAAWDYGKKAVNSYEQYCLDKETLEDIVEAGQNSVINNKGIIYPEVKDIRTGKNMVFPEEVGSRIPREERVGWYRNQSEANLHRNNETDILCKKDYIDEWYRRGYETPEGDGICMKFII